jgi:uncharacterized protein
VFLGGLLLAVAAADVMRAPDVQVTPRAYVWLVRTYQRVVSPIARSFVRCRYEPSCSHYSIAAVRSHGMPRGLVLTAHRLFRCRATVPIGTVDPVPVRAPHHSAMTDADTAGTAPPKR